MAQIRYNESSFRFTEPIRLFKQNDPYYFEVDNIPLKQLQENCLWLRDQLQQSLTENSVQDIKRRDIAELKPYATGGDRLVRVKPGRFTARVNDATSKQPLQYLQQVMGQAVGDVDAWSAATNNPGTFGASYNSLLVTALARFQSSVAADALNMNGLAERAFTWAVRSSDSAIDGAGTKTDRLAYTGGTGVGGYGPFVITQALLWAKSFNNTVDSFLIPSYSTTNEVTGFGKLPLAETTFVKKWRGVSRLAVVDVPNELSVEIPAFSDDDFYYIDENGTRQTIRGVESRVDLIFLYTKPVDAESVSIIRGGAVQDITTPVLGVVRGAGIGPSFQGLTDLNSNYTPETAIDEFGNSMILAHAADANANNLGFLATSGNELTQDVRGSFPSPDDLLNLAPLIAESLESNAIELVGQSILPVAYVFVQRAGNTDLEGAQIVGQEDVVDIRPFFRTAELTYNERAGIAAAMPQLSIANPAVGKAQMDMELRKVMNHINGFIADEENQPDNVSVVAAGYVFGGWNFGPEGALYDFYQSQFAGDDVTSNDSLQYIRQYITSKYGVGSNGAQISIPAYPDWDMAQWCQLQDISDKGLYPNDYINTFLGVTESAGASDGAIVAGSYGQITNADGTGPDSVNPPSRLASFDNSETGDAYSRVNFHYISKRIRFNREAAPWLADYMLDVQFSNCLPQTQRGFTRDDNNPMPSQYAGVWVEKGFDEFVIYVAFAANDVYQGPDVPRFPSPHSLSFTTTGKKKKTTQTLSVSERGGGRFSSFVVPVEDILTSNTTPISELNGLGYTGNPRVGKCTYPTVTWKMIGIPTSDSQYLYGNLNTTNPTITLKPQT